MKTWALSKCSVENVRKCVQLIFRYALYLNFDMYIRIVKNNLQHCVFIMFIPYTYPDMSIVDFAVAAMI